jgi:N-methylhydantoinase B/oxoprolinase/acetone carboxylase alpha subunit
MARAVADVRRPELEVFRALFSSIAEEMESSCSARRSRQHREGRAYCALSTARGTLVAQAATSRCTFGSAPLSARAAMAEHDFAPGGRCC